MTDTPSAPEPANQPVRFARDPATGLVVGYPYRYTPEGRLDWRAMVPAKYLYIAREYEDRVVKQQGKPLAEVDLLQVKDDWLRIRVAGLNYLAHLRGVSSCTYPQMDTREGFAAVVCQITFVGNIETSMQPETWSSIASATTRSMDKQFLPYMETFAENRAYGRCIKRALQINILSDIEVGGEGKKAAGDSDAPAAGQETSAEEGAAPSGFQPYHYLITKCRDNRDENGKPDPISFASLKAAAIEMNANTPPERANERCQTDPVTWTGFESIPPSDVYLLMGKMEAAAAKAAPAKKTPKSKG